MLRKIVRNGLLLSVGYTKQLLGTGVGKRAICFHETEEASVFRDKMLWLKEHYELVSLDELLLRSSPTKSLVAVTFDDGYASWHEVAAPILEELHIPATFFVCSGFVGLEGEYVRQFVTTRLRRQRRLIPLTKTQLSDLANRTLFEIGGHTIHHVDLGQIQDAALVKAEIYDDRRQLQEWTGQEVRWFAYPFGMKQHISTTAVSMLQHLQFTGACTFIPQFVTPLTDRYFIGRDGLGLHESSTVWQAWLQGGYDFFSALKSGLFGKI